MRKLSIVIMVVAMLALVLGAIPASATASQDMTTCNMDCCKADSPPVVEKDACEDACASKGAPHSAQVVEKSQDHCGCTMTNSPRQNPTIALNSVSESIQKPIVYADVALGLPSIYSPARQAKAVIFGSDSSPPVCGHFSPSLGRAPPVRFA